MNRNTSGRTRPALATTVAFLALVVALGSGSYAAGVLTGKDVRNGSLTGKDLKKDSVTGKQVRNLTGKDLDERSLGTVPTAEHALTADTVGYVDAGQILTTFGCQKGKVRGYARIKGNSGAMPNTFTPSPTYVDNVFNCSGNDVVVRRIAAGHYRVKFLDNPAFVASAQLRTDADADDWNVCSSIFKITVGADSTAFDVITSTCGTGSLQDVDFTLVLP